MLKLLFLFFNILFSLHSFVYIHRHNKFQLFLQKTLTNKNFIFISSSKHKTISLSNFNFSKIDKTFLKFYLGNIFFFNNNFYTAILPNNCFRSKSHIRFLKETDYLFLYLTNNKYLDKKRVNFILNASALFYLKSLFFIYYFFYLK